MSEEDKEPIISPEDLAEFIDEQTQMSLESMYEDFYTSLDDESRKDFDEQINEIYLEVLNLWKKN